MNSANLLTTKFFAPVIPPQVVERPYLMTRLTAVTAHPHSSLTLVGLTHFRGCGRCHFGGLSTGLTVPPPARSGEHPYGLRCGRSNCVTPTSFLPPPLLILCILIGRVGSWIGMGACAIGLTMAYFRKLGSD
jgi:hypothetical protein